MYIYIYIYIFPKGRRRINCNAIRSEETIFFKRTIIYLLHVSQVTYLLHSDTRLQ